MNKINLVGDTYGRLVVLSQATNLGRRIRWLCKCTCGNTCIVAGCNLRNRHTQSCGCFHKERVALIKTTHGMRRSQIYTTWINMRARCTNTARPDFQNYGGRGIRVCKRWLLFENFFADMGYPPAPEYTIERVNNNGNYTPSNCCWATRLEQTRNKRVYHRG